MKNRRKPVSDAIAPWLEPYVTPIIVCAFAVIVGTIAFLGMPNTAVAHAAEPSRETVQLVKMFKCWAQNDSCPSTIEGEANAWLKDIPPGRVIERKLKVTERHVVLVIFYEVPKWSTKQKSPAEKP